MAHLMEVFPPVSSFASVEAMFSFFAAAFSSITLPRMGGSTSWSLGIGFSLWFRAA
jgi:hypothetical protein